VQNVFKVGRENVEYLAVAQEGVFYTDLGHPCFIPSLYEEFIMHMHAGRDLMHRDLAQSVVNARSKVMDWERVMLNISINTAGSSTSQ